MALGERRVRPPTCAGWRVVHRAEQHVVLVVQGDRACTTSRCRGRSCRCRRRVDHPGPARRAGPRRALLPHDRVVRPLRGELLDDEPLGRGVGLRDDVGAAGLRSSQPLGADAGGEQRRLADQVAGERGVASSRASSSTGATVAGGVLWQHGAIQASYQGAPMSDKSPRQGMSKKSGKSIKEKRAEKRGKGDEETFSEKSTDEEEVTLLRLGVIGIVGQGERAPAPAAPGSPAPPGRRPAGPDHPRARVRRRSSASPTRQLARRTSPGSPRARRSCADSDVVVLPKPQHEDVAAMHAGQVLWGGRLREDRG